MYKPTVFADTNPCRGIRVAQAADIKFRVVNYHTFTGVATYLEDHCFALCRASCSYLPISSYASLSTVFKSPTSVLDANIASLARTDPIVGMLSQKSSLIVRVHSNLLYKLFECFRDRRWLVFPIPTLQVVLSSQTVQPILVRASLVLQPTK